MEIKLTTAIYFIIAILLIYLIVKPRASNAGNFTPDTSGLASLFWIVIFIIFTLIYGGVFWW